MGGLALTVVLMFLGAGATFFLGGIGGWVIGLIGALFFLVLPWQALKLIVKGGDALSTWASRDEEAEARAAEIRKIAHEAFRNASRRVL